MKQIYHHYSEWEEHKYGMWRNVHGSKREELLEAAIQFTGDAELYGEWMLKVIEEWPISCEQNLTCSSINRQAWIGHAACCLATDCPEDITRWAWGFLSEEQQDKANAKADEAILKWEQEHNARQEQSPLLEGKCQKRS